MPIPARPAFHPRWRVTGVPHEGVYFVAEHEHAVIEGETCMAIAQLIDGRRSSDVIAATLEQQIEPAHTYYWLSELSRQGFVRESVVRRGRAVRLANDPTIKRVAGGAEVVVVDDYLSGDLDSANRAALRTGRPWMLVRSSEEAIWVGPVFIPGRTACWSCLSYRLELTRPIDAYLAARSRASIVIARPAPASAAPIARMKERLERETTMSALGAVITFDDNRSVLRRHKVERRPQCPVCGDPTLYARQLGRFDSFAEGCSPQLEILAGALVDPVTGITASVSRISAVDHPLVHVYAAAPTSYPATAQLAALQHALRQRSSGSGTTDAEAIVAAIAESVERLSSTAHGDEPRVQASLDQLGRTAIHPNDCMLFSDAQLREERPSHERRNGWRDVPLPFDSTTVVDWTSVWSLISREPRLLPTAFLYLNAWTARGRQACAADTNGNAAGASRADAVVRGFLELVERDSIALWWYNRAPRPQVDLAAIEDTYCRDLVVAYESMGREYWVLDITSDLGVPAFAAITRRLDSRREDIVFGFGAHFDGVRALRHAVVEMNQMVASLATTHDVEGALPPVHARWVTEATLANQPYLRPSAGARSQTTHVGQIARRHPQADLDLCRDIVAQHQMDLLVLDMTRRDIGVPVVKVIVPGLRPATPRFAPGRLFDAPVRLGWRTHTATEEALNPVPFFL